MQKIKVSITQDSQSIKSCVEQTQQSIGVGFSESKKVYHDSTLKGDGTPSNLLGISEEILRKINTFVFEFDATQSSWTINHNMNKRPSVTIVDSAENVMTCSTEYIDENTLVITFNAPFKGTAYLN